MFGADDPSGAEDRSVVVTAEVQRGIVDPGPVTVTFPWDGAERTAQVPVDRAIGAGEPLLVRVDREDPSRVWADGSTVARTDDPPWAIAAFIVAIALAGVAVAAVVSARARPVG